MSYKCKTNKKWYHNNEGKLIKLAPEDKIPEGFISGKGPTGKPAWSRGLTKNTDPRVARISEGGKNKKVTSWNKGQTKSTNPKLAEIGKNISKSKEGVPNPKRSRPDSEETRRKKSESRMGCKSWSKGLTKENNESLMSISNKLKNHTFNKNLSSERREEINQKIYNTMKKNNSFNSSKGEDELYKILINKFGKEDIETQYNKDPRYPFHCDFYIKSKDLFIEYQGAFEHGPHPFNPNNEEDLKLVEEWEEKANIKGPKSRYWNYINWWTIKDPLKLKYLRDNKLNFVLIYPRHNQYLLITE